MIVDALTDARNSPAITPHNEACHAIAGIAVANTTAATAIGYVEAALRGGRPMKLAFLNAHCVNVSRKNASYRKALRDFLVLPDGVGLDIAAKLLHGSPFTENLNGTDFVPRLVAGLSGHRRIALLGAAPGVAERAAMRLRELAPNHEFVAVSDGFFSPDDLPDVLERLEQAKADIVIVALGVPRQELFIGRHLDQRHGQVFLAVGALFDFLAGDVRRAPRAVRALRLEWAWRLILEPKRLWRRYVLGNPAFMKDLLLDKLRLWCVGSL